MKEKVVQIKVDGKTKFCPAYELNGKEYLVSHQGQLWICDTEEQALEYFKD